MLTHRTLESRLVVTATVFLGLAGSCLNGFAGQSTGDSACISAATRKRVAQIMEVTLKQGEGNVHGIHYYTRVPPSPEAVEELRKLGPDAISVLADYASSGGPQQQRLALELLCHVGGKAVIAPLDLFLQKSASPTVRETALRCLARERADSVRQILTRTGESDPDGGVRKLARTLLAEYPSN